MNQFDSAILDQNLRAIDKIYETISIYKSILIVNESHMVQMYADLLSKRDYPVAVFATAYMFNRDEARMLVLSHNEVNHFEEHRGNGIIDMKNVTTILYVDPIDTHFPEFENIEEFFL